MQGLVRSANEITASLIGGLARADEVTPTFANALERGANRVRARAPAVSETLRAMASAVRTNNPAALHAIEKSQGAHPLDGNAAALRDLARASAGVLAPPHEDFSAAIEDEKEIAAGVAGFIPVAAEIVSLPDLLASIKHLARDRNAAAVVETAFAGAALVPGLQFLKKERSIAGPMALRAAAVLEDPVARAGLKRLARSLPEKTYALVESEVRLTNVARTELIARLERHIPELPPSIRDVAARCRNGLQDHLKPSDVVGWVRDHAGLPVRQMGSGRVFEHEKEVKEVLLSMKKIATKLELVGGDALQETKHGLYELSSRLAKLAEIVK